MDADLARQQLLALEPVFHHEELGADRAAFEKLIVDDYWEVGASGGVYSRDFVLDTLVERHGAPRPDPWEIQDFRVRHLEGSTWLATYELHQGSKITRRSTLWTMTDRWRAIYHQGTIS